MPNIESLESRGGGGSIQLKQYLNRLITDIRRQQMLLATIIIIIIIIMISLRLGSALLMSIRCLYCWNALCIIHSRPLQSIFDYYK